MDNFNDKNNEFDNLNQSERAPLANDLDSINENKVELESFHNNELEDSANENSANENSALINFQTINEAEQLKQAKSKKMKKKIGKLLFGTTAAAICLASAGFGIGVGLNTSRNVISKSELTSFGFEKVANTGANEDLLLTSTNSLTNIINEVQNSVVNISTTAVKQGFFNQLYENSGSGSGIIFKETVDTVYIITNAHVVEGASTVYISISGKEQIASKLVGRNYSSDLAVISVSKTDLEKQGIPSVSVAKFADSENIQVGEFVVAIGNALGEGKTVTKGIISAKDKEINIDGTSLTVLQTDAAINPGNSGGALVNTDGLVVGINTAKLASSEIEGIGYAIPSNTIIQNAEAIIENGDIEKPYLGIMGFTITDSFKTIYNIDYDGVFITEVQKGSNAESAGINATDIILGLNDKEIKSVEDLSSEISKSNVGDEVTFKIIRNGAEEKTITTILKGNKNF